MGNIFLPNGLELKDVLFFPSFHFNLISVNKLVKDLQCLLVFSDNNCFIQEPLKKEHLLLGKAHNSLYYVQDDKNPRTKQSLPASLSAQQQIKDGAHAAKLWHIRIGHLPFNKLGFLFPELQKHMFEKDFMCTVCPIAKKTRNVFHKSSIKSVETSTFTHRYLGSFET